MATVPGPIAVEFDPRAAEVLGKSVLRAAAHLDLNGEALARVLGVSASTTSRLAAGRYALNPLRKEWNLALLLIRLYQSLDSIVGTQDAARTWMRAENQTLRGVPLALITDIQGLVHVVDYLDHHRGRL